MTAIVFGNEYRACVKRETSLMESDRGPDSLECMPGSTPRSHEGCLLDYSDLGPRIGFVCGCECHDPEPVDSGKDR